MAHFRVYARKISRFGRFGRARSPHSKVTFSRLTHHGSDIDKLKELKAAGTAGLGFLPYIVSLYSIELFFCTFQYCYCQYGRTLWCPLSPSSVKLTAMEEWTPNSWRTKPIKHCPEYPDPKALSNSVSELKRLPPIVHPKEIEKLKQNLRDVALGKAFLLQGGDCAELFDYCEQTAIESKIKLLLQMSLVLVWGADKRVVRIGRMAGQYAKPRSSATEVVDGKEVPSFKGDILNGFSLDERELDPGRLIR